MGVPKFFRFISERYPLISTAFPSNPPQIDNLYLDMNGIIHNCVRASPGNGSGSSKRYVEITITTRSAHDIYLDIFKYIDNIVGMLTPRRVLYLAVDGVAPRAKMNQQRSRRFRSAKERLEEHQRKQREDPMYAAASVNPFDSNCITPGTSFMYALTHALRYFVARKISEDPAWSSLQVVLSGPEAPGEGEHKIMEYIRSMRESGNILPNTRHCVYGLDADLIMLALVTHEPHFFLLREKVDFNAFWKKKNGPRTATALDLVTFGEFELMSIGVMREYIALELGANGNNRLPFFDPERLYDDFVLILMLIGNDFLPNLPTLDIADGTLSIMLHLYKRIFPLLGGYLTNAGTISSHRFEFFIAKLALLEEDVLRYRKDQSSNDSSRRRKGNRALSYTPSDLDDIFALYAPENGAVPPRPLSAGEMRRETLSCRAMLSHNSALASLKEEYYSEKFGFHFVNNQEDIGVGDLVSHYVKGISWTLKYYIEGCRQWRWYFPFHYAPLASDIGNIDSPLRRFENNIVRDEPFKPWEQLLSVLPPLSAWCLPKPFRQLMTSSSSPIQEYYPEEFETDLNGKRNEWEAVVLLPFVDEKKLIQAMKSVASEEITDAERKCNELGSSLLFTLSESFSQTFQSPFPDRLSAFTSKAKTSSLKVPILPEGTAFKPKVLDGTLPAGSSESFADMPTLMHYAFDTYLQRVGVNVFGTQSKAESLVLNLHVPVDDDDTDALPNSGGSENTPLMSIPNANALVERGIVVGAPIWFGYPWRRTGLIQSVAAKSVTFALERGLISSRPTPQNDFEQIANSVAAMLMQKCAVNVDNPRIVVGIVTDNADRTEEGLLYQHDKLVVRRAVEPLQAALYMRPLSKGQVVLYAGHGAYFGHKCVVMSTAGAGSIVKVEFDHAVGAAREPPFGYRVISAANTQRWFSLSRLASEVGLSVSVVDTFLGSLRVRLRAEKDEVDLGLGVKYVARALYVPGYARRDDRHHYSFSDKCAALLRNYSRAFPILFEAIERTRKEDGRSKGGGVYVGTDLLPNVNRSDDAFRAIETWLGLQEVATLPLVNAKSDVLSREIVLELERQSAVISMLRDEYEAILTGGDAMRMTKDVPRAALVTGLEGLEWGRNDAVDHSSLPLHFEPLPPSAAGVRLGDRVVNRLASDGVPFALRGTVVGIHPKAGEAVGGKNDYCYSFQDEAPAVVEVIFDSGFIGGGTLGGRCSDGRGKAVPAHSLFIVRPERDNVYYSEHYSRVAAKVAAKVPRPVNVDKNVINIEAVAVDQFMAAISTDDKLNLTDVKEELQLEPKSEPEVQAEAKAEPEVLDHEDEALVNSADKNDSEDEDNMSLSKANSIDVTEPLEKNGAAQKTAVESSSQAQVNAPLPMPSFVKWKVQRESTGQRNKFRTNAQAKHSWLSRSKSLVDKAATERDGERSFTQPSAAVQEWDHFDSEAQLLAHMLLQQVRLKEKTNADAQNVNTGGANNATRVADKRNVRGQKKRNDGNGDDYVSRWLELQEEASKNR